MMQRGPQQHTGHPRVCLMSAFAPPIRTTNLRPCISAKFPLACGNTKKKWVATNQKGDPTQFRKQNADRTIDRQIIRLNDRHVCVDIYVHIHVHHLTQPPSIHNTATTPSPRFQRPAPLAGRHLNLLSDFKPEGRTNTILKIEYRPYPRWTNS